MLFISLFFPKPYKSHVPKFEIEREKCCLHKAAAATPAAVSRGVCTRE